LGWEIGYLKANLFLLRVNFPRFNNLERLVIGVKKKLLMPLSKENDNLKPHVALFPWELEV